MNPSTLFELITTDLGLPLRKSGMHLYWRCPFHSDHDPSLHLKSGDNYFHCFGCGKSGGAFTWLLEYRRLKYAEANQFLVQSLSQNPRSPLNPAATALVSTSPSRLPDELQDSWHKIIQVCQKQLWSPAGERAREYLHRRGLHDVTLHSPFWRIGFSSGQKIAGIWVGRGIVIPCFTTNIDLEIEYIHYIKIRHPRGLPRYRKLPGGGANLAGIYGARNRQCSDVLFLTEGEFDCLLLSQREQLGGAGDLVAAATLGSANARIDFRRWGLWLCSFRHIFIAYDADPAGKAGCDYWQGLSERVHPAPLPAHPPVKDITEFWKAGGNLADWVIQTLSQINDPSIFSKGAFHETNPNRI